MTLGQAKAMAMKLMDEYMVDTPPQTMKRHWQN